MTDNEKRDLQSEDDAQTWNAQHAAFLEEYRDLLAREGPALIEFRTF